MGNQALEGHPIRCYRPSLSPSFSPRPPSLASVSPCSSLGSPSWLEPAWGGPPRAACRQRRLTASSGSIRWIYPLDLSVGFGRQPRHRRQPAGRQFAHSISIGDGLVWDCPSLLLSLPHPPGAVQCLPRASPLREWPGGRWAPRVSGVFNMLLLLAQRLTCRSMTAKQQLH